VTFLLAAIVAGVGSLVRPIQTALFPALARTPGELVAANVAASTGEGLGTFVGPLLAGVLVAWTGSVPASVLVAAGFAAAAAAVTGVQFEREADARGGGGHRGAVFPLGQMAGVLRRYPGPALVVFDFAAQVFVRGLLLTLIVVASIELLGMGDTGVGLLNAVLGLGGLAGALGGLGLVGARGLNRTFTFALVGWGVPLIFIAVGPAAVVAVGALLITGVSNAVLDVSGYTLMQRGVRNEDRVTIFAAFELLVAVAMLLGSLAAPVLIAILGIRAGFAVAGAILPLLAIATARGIGRHSPAGALTAELTHLFRSNRLLAPLPLTVLDRLAESLAPRSFEPGDIVMQKGEPGDHYLLIASGTVEILDGERTLRTCGRGEGVGEIALLRTVPRTATVVAQTHVDTYAIDAATFLSAIAGPAATAAAESVVTERLAHSAAG
jgi:Cyclic nucleotide-binding domain